MRDTSPHRTALAVVHLSVAMFFPWEFVEQALSEPPVYDEPADWSYLVSKHFDAEDYDVALSVLNCESGGNPTADNPSSTAQGGWQFLKSTWGWANTQSGFELDGYPTGPNDPEQSTMLAAWLQDTYGWSQWVCHGMINRSATWAPIVTVDLVADEHKARK